MKKVTKVLLVLAVLFFYSPVFAEEVPPVIPPPDPVPIHLTITSGATSVFDQDITTTACNSDNGATTDTKVTAYCAILQSGVQSDWNWDWAPGAFLNSLADIAGYTSKDKDGNDVYHYWSWSLNGGYAEVGLNQYELQANDLISLTFIDPIEEPAPEVPPTNTEEHHGSSGSYSSRKVEKATFDLKKAFDFLLSQQKENGSFGEDLYTDWVAIAIASSETQSQEIQSIVKLVKYFGESTPTGTNLTDHERHAMALMSLGLNPYNANGKNYIEKITSAFDGKQFGDPKEDNDDIFALIVLQNAGFTLEEKMVGDDINFVLSRQNENGSWDNSVDMTGAGIQALSAFSPTPGIGESLAKAKEFLEKNQKDNGGWDDNASSTAWAQGGILALGEKPEDWKKDDNTPLDYLATVQDTDGGIKNENLENRIWQTAYVVSSLSGKTWNQTMQNFEKMEPLVTVAQPKQTVPKPKIVKPKPENPTNQNTAAVIESVVPSNEPGTEDRGWFSKLIFKIFSVF